MKASKSALGEGGIKSFFTAMLPNFEKTRIEDAVNSSFKELAMLEEMYGVETIDYRTVMANDFKLLLREVNNNVPGFRGDLIMQIQSVIAERLKEKAALEKFIDEIYGKVVLRDAMDYRKVHMLRYIECLSFFIFYARKLLIVATNRLIQATASSANIKTAVSVVDKMDIEFVNDPRNVRSFSLILGALTHNVKEIRKMLDKLAKVSFVPENHDIAVRQHGASADPLKLGMIPILGTITYHIGLSINLIIAKYQDLAKEEKEKLQVKVLLLRRLREDTVDENATRKLDKQINYYDNRINKLSATLEEMAEGD